MDNSFITVLCLKYGPEKDSLQEPFFNKDDENATEHERSSSWVSQVAEEWKRV